MPENFAVTSSSIDSLLRRLEVRLVTPRAPLWELSNVITPVSLVDSGISLRADVQANPFLFATVGILSGPAAGVLLADTGALPAGGYEFKTWLTSAEPDNTIRAQVEHRNAADAANNWGMLYSTYRNNVVVLEWVETLLTNERIRIAMVSTATGGIAWQGFIWRRLVTP